MRLIRLLKNDLAREVGSWVDENIISIAQAESICSQYGVDFHNQQKHAYGYYVLVTLGYLFIGLALITLLSANWENIPRAVRMLGLITLTAITNIFGIYKVSCRENASAVGCFFLGGLFYGASIMLIAQIYHIGEHFPDGIFWWAAGVLPVAVLMRSNLLMIMSATLSFIWFFTESHLNFYPLMFPVFLAAIAWHCFRVKQSNILFLALVTGFGFWAEYSFSWVIGGSHKFVVGPGNLSLGVGIFFLFYGLSKWFLAKKNSTLVDYGTLLAIWTLRFTIVALLVFSFEEPWRALIAEDWQVPRITLALALLFPALSIWLVHASKTRIISISVFSAMYFVVLLVVMGTDNKDLGFAFQIGDNIVLILSGIWLIMRGIQSAVSHYFFFGILTVLATGLLRYIDLVGDYIGGAILFGIFAAILLSTAKYWKSNHLDVGPTAVSTARSTGGPTS